MLNTGLGLDIWANLRMYNPLFSIHTFNASRCLKMEMLELPYSKSRLMVTNLWNTFIQLKSNPTPPPSPSLSPSMIEGR